jgi:hypothetical protein
MTDKPPSKAEALRAMREARFSKKEGEPTPLIKRRAARGSFDRNAYQREYMRRRRQKEIKK